MQQILEQEDINFIATCLRESLPYVASFTGVQKSSILIEDLRECLQLLRRYQEDMTLIATCYAYEDEDGTYNGKCFLQEQGRKSYTSNTNIKRQTAEEATRDAIKEAQYLISRSRHKETAKIIIKNHNS